jgi:hypothetical protein
MLMEGLERISESQATLEKIDSSVLFEFEVRSDRDPNNVANFKFSTLVLVRDTGVSLLTGPLG